MAALQTRAEIAAQDDYYLCPLSALQMPAAELDQLLEPVFAGRKRPRKVFTQQDDGSDTEPSAKEEPIAVGFEYTVRVSGKDHSEKDHLWNERRLVIRSLSSARSEEKSLRERIKRAQNEIKSLNERKQGKPVLRSLEQTEEAARSVAEAHRVSEYLQIKVKHEAQERTKRRYGSRPAESICEEQFTVHGAVDERGLEQAIRRMGWRVYVTNQPANELSLEQAVCCLGLSGAVPGRAMLWAIERLPVIADADLFAIRTSSGRLDPALDDRLACAGYGAIYCPGKYQRTRPETLWHICRTAWTSD
ncbi:MAG: hypothetical protein J2P21_27020 [Chloracidobacterium sp.]|nr:hypothetical protein [Chloracidobacterium sp.]